MTHSPALRPARSEDLAALYALNEAAVPNVGAVSRDALARLIEISAATLVATRGGRPVGFILAIGPGADYDSPNYRWFDSRAARLRAPFLYIDRIAVDAAERGGGIGATLYEALGAFAPAGAPLCCEVNTAPPNPGSLRFHARLGFVEVGKAVYAPGVKEVVFLERRDG